MCLVAKFPSRDVLELPFEVGITALGFKPRFEAAVGLSIGGFQDPPVAKAVQRAFGCAWRFYGGRSAYMDFAAGTA